MYLVNKSFYRMTWDHENINNTAFCDGWFVTDYPAKECIRISYRLDGITCLEKMKNMWGLINSAYKDIQYNEQNGRVYLSRYVNANHISNADLGQYFDKVFANLSGATSYLLSGYSSIVGTELSEGEKRTVENLSDDNQSQFVGHFLTCLMDGKEIKVETPEPVFLPEQEGAKTVWQSAPANGDAKVKGFASIAGMESLKQELEERVLWMINNREKAKRYRIQMPSGLLLYGPPGCGKTFFAQKFAEESGMKFKLIRPSDLADRYIHGTQELIANVFDEAREQAPCIICFDEIDALVPTRDSDDAHFRGDEVNEFLVQMNNAGARGVFVIGTTNRKEKIDPAVLRTGRLDIHVEIPAPDQQTRKSLFEYHLEGRPLDVNIDTDKLAGLTEGYASSDITAIVNTAALKAARADVQINQDILEKAIAVSRTSLVKEQKQQRIGFSAAKIV